MQNVLQYRCTYTDTWKWATNRPGTHTDTHTCVLCNILQQQWVLGQPLHLYGNDVLELQPTALGLTLRLLRSTHTHRVRLEHLCHILHYFASAKCVHVCLCSILGDILCVCGTCIKMLKRGSRFCLVLIWSRAHDWWLQNLAVSFWNHSPSVPPNWNTRAHTNITIKDCVVASWKKLK